MDQARQFCEAQDIELHLRKGDMRRIPFEDETFDYVYEHYSMCHLSKQDTALAVREMYRVLKRRGLCFLGLIAADSWPKSFFGQEKRPGEYWGEEGGELTLHSVFSNEEGDALVSAWEIVSNPPAAARLRPMVLLWYNAFVEPTHRFSRGSSSMTSTSIAAAYGGAGWSPRTATLRQEIGQVWSRCGTATEWSPLTAVLLHRPGAELAAVTDPNAAQMLAPLDASRARAQHDALARAYREAGVTVHYVEPSETPPPNLMFVADLMSMTPEGAILGRPASTVRAGEERWIARRLADLGVPILRSVRGTGTFEGADALWVDPQTVLLATGIRTNTEGAAQVASLLDEMGLEVVPVGLPCGAMHLMGTLRFPDRDLAIAWRERVPHAALEALQARGYNVLFVPDEGEAQRGMALNFVTLGPRHILMAAGNPIPQAFYERAGITCQTAEVDELLKAAGGIGCLTGVLQRGENRAGEGQDDNHR